MAKKKYVGVTALWERDILLEHPPGSGQYERAKPVAFLFGNTADISEDAYRWFASQVFTFERDESGIEPDGTRVLVYSGTETKWQVRYRIVEEKTNVAGLREIPLSDDPVYTLPKSWEASY